VRGEQIFIIRGEGGRDTLRSALEQRGATVTFCELYRRETDTTHQLAINRLLEAGAVQVVVAHSVDVLRNFLQLLDNDSLEALHRIAVLVPSQGAADLALATGCGYVIQAQGALPASMVDALVGWYTANSPNVSNPLYPH
jgi:uroporphyrinogen-III synthase